VINESARSANLDKGHLVFEGEKVATVSSVISDQAALAASRSSGLVALDDLASVTQPRPFEVPSGGGMPLGVLWTPAENTAGQRFAALVNPSLDSGAIPDYSDATLRVCPYGGRAWTFAKPARARATPPAASQNVPDKPLQVRLVLEFQPGGQRSVPVVIHPVQRPSTATVSPDVSMRSGWQAFIELNGTEIEWLYFERRGGDLTALGAATLEIWNPSGQSSKAVRPYAGASTLCFPVKAAGSGLYAWTLVSEGETVGVGRFTLPCRRPRIDPDARKQESFWGVPADENDGLRWPRRDGLKWPHLASVVVGVRSCLMCA
jgi:hypothetical protein